LPGKISKFRIFFIFPNLIFPNLNRKVHEKVFLDNEIQEGTQLKLFLRKGEAPKKLVRINGDRIFVSLSVYIQ